MIKPLRDQLIVVIDDIERETAAGILLTDPEFRAIPKTGVVYSVGSGVDDPKVGDRVVFLENSLRGFKHDGKPLLRLKAEQVIGVFTSER